MNRNETDGTTPPDTFAAPRKSHRSLKIVLLCLLAFVLLLGGSSVAYVQDYYHADQAAIDAIESPLPGITIGSGIGHVLVFSPEDSAAVKAGLIFYPGAKVEYTAYAPLMSLLAQQGVLCVLVRMPGNLSLLNMDAAGNIVKNYPEITRWYIGGHSLGGVCASMYLQKHSADFQGLLLLASYSSVDLSKTGLSVLSLYGSCDGVLNRKRYEASKRNLPTDFSEQILEGGCHAYFGSYGAQKGDGTPTCTPEAQQAWAADAILDWIG